MANRFLYLARHGDAINEGVLSETGQQQAWLLGQRLADVTLTAIHHSPLPRAVQTAQSYTSRYPERFVCASGQSLASRNAPTRRR
jgi:probable phosphoglycerate mutase